MGGLSRRLLAYCFCQVGDAAAAAKSRIKKVSVGEQTTTRMWLAGRPVVSMPAPRARKSARAGRPDKLKQYLRCC